MARNPRVAPFLGLFVGLFVGLCVAAQTPAQPAPRPLAQREIVKVAIAAKNETLAALLLADALGELGKENIQIEYFVQRPSDGLVLLATGRVHVLGSQPGAAFFNAVASGVNVKMVAPTGVPAAGNKQGFWVSRSWLGTRKYSPELLKGQAIATPAGAGSTNDYALEIDLRKVNLTIRDVSQRQLALMDILPALENGAINIGLLFDGVWQKGDSKKIEYAFGSASDILGGFFFGPVLLSQRRDIGEALMRAMVRTVQTHLSGDYHRDPVVAPALAKIMGISLEQLQQAGGLRFQPDMPIPTHAASTLQRIYSLTPKILSYKDPLPDERVFDRSFAMAAGAGPVK